MVVLSPFILFGRYTENNSHYWLYFKFICVNDDYSICYKQNENNRKRNPKYREDYYGHMKLSKSKVADIKSYRNMQNALYINNIVKLTDDNRDRLNLIPDDEIALKKKNALSKIFHMYFDLYLMMREKPPLMELVGIPENTRKEQFFDLAWSFFKNENADPTDVKGVLYNKGRFKNPSRYMKLWLEENSITLSQLRRKKQFSWYNAKTKKKR